MKEFLIQIKARPVLISMLVLALLLFGLISFYRLNFSLYPSPVYPGLSIHLDFPGADPLKMEQQITNPIEEAISIVGGIKEMRSFSEAGKMKVNIEFEKETDLNYKILELKERIDLVSHKFPREAHKPGIIKYDPEQVPVFIVSFKSEKMDLTAIREYLERFIKPELESIEGISQIIIAGGRVREVLVSCDRQQMEAYAISLREVVDALSSNNTNQTITKIYKDAREQKVYSDGKFKDLYEIRELPVSLDNGRNPVLIKDIAEVKMAFRDEDSSSRVNAKEMVSLYIYKTYIGDPLHISKQSKKIIEALYHRNTNYEVTFDQGDLIKHTYQNLLFCFFGAFIFQFLYIYKTNPYKLYYVLLHIVSISISFFIFAFILYVLQIPLNMLSISGASVAIYFWFFYTSLAFVYKPKEPIIAMKYFSSILSYILIYLLLVSLLFLLFSKTTAIHYFITAFCTGIYFLLIYMIFPILILLYKPVEIVFPEMNQIIDLNPVFTMIKKFSFYEKIKKISFYVYIKLTNIPSQIHSLLVKFYLLILKYSKYVFLLSFLLIPLSIYSFFSMKKELGVSFKEKELIAFLEFPSGTSFEYANKITLGIEKKIMDLKGIKQLVSKTETERSFFIIKVNNDIFLDETYTNYIKNSVGKTEPAYFYFSSDNIQLTTREMVLDILGNDLDELEAYVTKLVTIAKAMENVVEVVYLFKPPRDELLLYILGYKLRGSLLNLLEIGDFLKLAIQGGIASKFYEKDREIDIRVRFDKKYRDSKDSLSLIRVKNLDGKYVPITEVVWRKESKVPVKIYHKNKKRLYSISIRFADVSDKKIEEALSRILAFPLPENYRIEAGKKSGRTFDKSSELQVYVIFALPVFIYMMLSAYYESFKYSLKPALSIIFLLALKILFIYGFIGKMTYPILLALLLFSGFDIFLLLVIKSKGGIYLTKNLIKRKPERLFLFFPIVLSILPFFLFFLLFADTAVLYIYDFFFVFTISCVFGTMFIPIFLKANLKKETLQEIYKKIL